MRNFYFIVFIFAAFFDACSHRAKAGVIDTFVQVQCIKALNTLKVDVFSGTSETEFENARENQKKLWESYGIRNYRSMVGTIRLVNGDGTPSDHPRDNRLTVIDLPPESRSNF